MRSRTYAAALLKENSTHEAHTVRLALCGDGEAAPPSALMPAAPRFAHSGDSGGRCRGAQSAASGEGGTAAAQQTGPAGDVGVGKIPTPGLMLMGEKAASSAASCAARPAPTSRGPGRWWRCNGVRSAADGCGSSAGAGGD